MQMNVSPRTLVLQPGLELCTLWFTVWKLDHDTSMSRLTLSVYPFKGTGVPHFRSRVIHRGFSPSLTHEFVMSLALADQLPSDVDFCKNTSRAGASLGRSRNRCLEVLMTGVSLQTLHLGFCQNKIYNTKYISPEKVL